MKSIFRIVALVSLLFCCLYLHATATVSGTIKDPGGAVVPNSFVRFELANTNNGQCSAGGSSLGKRTVDFNADLTTGAVSGTLYRNDTEVSCAGSFNSRYNMTIYRKGVPDGPSKCVNVTADFDISAPQFCSTPPPVANPAQYVTAAGTNHLTGVNTFDDARLKGPMVDIRTYGCVGDSSSASGSTNLSCLNAISTSAGQTGIDVYVPVGVYYLSDEFVSSNPIRFWCAGGAGYGASQNRDGAVFVGTAADKWLMRFVSTAPLTNVTHTGPSFYNCTFRDGSATLNVAGSGQMRGGVKFTDISRWQMYQPNFESFNGNRLVAAISSQVRASGTVTVTTATSHGLAQGDFVRITGSADATFNGFYSVVSTPTSVTFTVKQAKVNASASAGGSVYMPAVGVFATSVITQGDSADALMVQPQSYDMAVTIGADTATANSMSAPHIYAGDIGCYQICVFEGAGASAPTLHDTHLNLRDTAAYGIWSAAQQGEFFPRVEGYPLLTRPGTAVFLAANSRNAHVGGIMTNVDTIVETEANTLTGGQGTHDLNLSGAVNFNRLTKDSAKGTTVIASDWGLFMGAWGGSQTGYQNQTGFARRRIGGTNAVGLVTTNQGLPIDDTLPQYLAGTISRTSGIVTFTTSSPVDWKSVSNGDSTGADNVLFYDMSDTTNFPNNTWATIASVSADKTTFTVPWAGSDIGPVTVTGKVQKSSPGWMMGKGNSRFALGSGCVGDAGGPVATSTGCAYFDWNNGALSFFADNGLTVGSSFTPTLRGKFNISTGNWEFNGLVIGTTNKATLSTASLSTARTFTFPDKAGTFAMTSDVPASVPGVVADSNLTGNAADQTAYTVTIPANTVGAGHGLDVWLDWQRVSGTGSQTVKVTIGTATLLNCTFTNSSAGAAVFLGRMQNAAGVQNVQRITSPPVFVTSTSICAANAATGTVDFSSSQTLTVIYNAAATESVSFKMVNVDIH